MVSGSNDGSSAAKRAYHAFTNVTSTIANGACRLTVLLHQPCVDSKPICCLDSNMASSTAHRLALTPGKSSAASLPPWPNRHGTRCRFFRISSVHRPINVGRLPANFCPLHRLIPWPAKQIPVKYQQNRADFLLQSGGDRRQCKIGYLILGASPNIVKILVNGYKRF